MNKNIMKKLKCLPSLLHVVLVTSYLSVDEACASHRNITAAFKKKGGDMGEMIVDGFGIVALVVLAGITAVWSLTKDKNTQKSMEDWGKKILIGATIIYGIGTAALFTWMKS